MSDFSELENQLKKLRPIPPSENLTTRIERALAESGSTMERRGRERHGWATRRGEISGESESRTAERPSPRAAVAHQLAWPGSRSGGSRAFPDFRAR